MRVLYVLKRYPRLSETFVVREILEIERLGVEVAIDALMTPEPGLRHPAVDDVAAPVRYLPRRPTPREVRGAALRVVVRRPGAVVGQVLATAGRARAAGEDRRRWWRRFAQALLVADRVRAERIDHVHAHFATAAAEVAVPAARMAGVPVTVTAHAKDVFHQANEGLLVRRLRDAGAVVTVTEHNRDHLEQRFDIPVAVVRNGVPLGEARAPHDPGTTALCVARLVPKKGVDTLLRAAALVPGLRLDVVGDGPLRPELEALADRLGVSDRVRWHGAVTADEVQRLHRRADLAVLLCRVDEDGDRDGLPTVLVEALAHGVPVVSTDVVGIPELVRHRVTGLLVPPDDPESAAAAMQELVADPLLADALGRAGRELVATEYDPAGSARRLSAVWTEVAR